MKRPIIIRSNKRNFTGFKKKVIFNNPIYHITIYLPFLPFFSEAPRILEIRGASVSGVLTWCTPFKTEYTHEKYMMGNAGPYELIIFRYAEIK